MADGLYAVRSDVICEIFQSLCTNCSDHIALCSLHNDACTYDTTQDRRRPVSKAYVAALEDRVAWLETLLEKRQERDNGRDNDEERPDRAMEDSYNTNADRPPVESSGKTVQLVEYLQV